MAMGPGISTMGRGAAIDPETFLARQKLADELYKSALANPQQPELSWTQGAARLAQAVASGYERGSLNKDRDAYKQQRLQDMQKLGGALGTGDYKSVIGELSDPDSQMMAFSLAKSDMDRNNQVKNQMDLKKFDYGLDMQKYDRQTADKRQDRSQDKDFELDKLNVSDQYKTRGMGIQSQLQREEKLSTPVASVQAKYADYARIASDDNAPPELREAAKGQLDVLQKTIAAMSPPKTSVSVDTGMKSETAGAVETAKLDAREAATEKTKNKKLGLASSDNLFRMEQISEALESGALNNLNTTEAGAVLAKLADRMGMEGGSGAIATYLQTASKQLFDARTEMQGQGTISDSETTLLGRTVLLPNDTKEAIEQKVHVFKQIYARQKAMGDLTNKWVSQFGSLAKKGPNGKSFYDAQQALIAARPLMSLDDTKKAQQEAASKQAQPEATNQQPQPVQTAPR